MSKKPEELPSIDDDLALPAMPAAPTVVIPTDLTSDRCPVARAN